MGLTRNAEHARSADTTSAERRQLELRAQEYRMAIETSGDGFWVADLRGRLLEVNAAYAEASGYSHDELLTLHIQDMDAFDSTLDTGMHMRMEEARQTGHARFVSVLRARDGSRWPVEMVLSYSPMEGGRFFCFSRDLTEQQKSAQRIWHQANFDQLTDLPNRALFFDRLSQECSAARRNGKRVALLYADLDAFKPVNDQFGHAAGDAALQTVAARWQSCVRGMDTIARLGGDEFAIIAGQIEGQQEAAAIAEKLIAALREDITLPAGHSCSLGVSIGIGMYPDNAVEMDSLLSVADRAMFACKARGKNAFAFSSAQANQPPDPLNWISFKETYLVGISEIDEQHRLLIRLMNELNQDLSARISDVQIGTRFDELIAYTLFHFQTEHRYMLAHHYPQTKAHDYEHGQLANELQLIVDRHNREGDLLVLQKLKDWLLAHIQNSDKALGRYLLALGVR